MGATLSQKSTVDVTVDSYILLYIVYIDQIQLILYRTITVVIYLLYLVTNLAQQSESEIRPG